MTPACEPIAAFVWVMLLLAWIGALVQVVAYVQARQLRRQIDAIRETALAEMDAFWRDLPAKIEDRRAP